MVSTVASRQWQLLDFLLKNKAGMTVDELAEALNITRTAVNQHIAGLERDGYVKREPDPDDRRMMSVRLTPKAEIFLREMLPAHFQIMAKVMAPLSESERKTLVRLLTKVLLSATELGSAQTGPAVGGHSAT